MALRLKGWGGCSRLHVDRPLLGSFRLHPPLHLLILHSPTRFVLLFLLLTLPILICLPQILLVAEIRREYWQDRWNCSLGFGKTQWVEHGLAPVVTFVFQPATWDPQQHFSGRPTIPLSIILVARVEESIILFIVGGELSVQPQPVRNPPVHSVSARHHRA